MAIDKSERPRVAGDNAFAQYLAAGKLMGTTCTKCGALHVPPRALCTACHGTTLDWTEVSGRGRLIAFTVIAICPPQMIAAGYGRDNPYCSGVVALDEGPRLAARIEGLDLAHPDTITIGTLLQVVRPCPAGDALTFELQNA